MRSFHTLVGLAAGLLLSACVAQSTSSSAPQGASTADARRSLLGVLETPVSPAQDSQFAVYEATHDSVQPVLESIAADTAATPVARANALLRLADARDPAFALYRNTVRASDPRVRAATLRAAGALLETQPFDAVQILAIGLVDADLRVQGRALQELGESDPSLLRWYVGAGAPPLRPIAVQLLRVAEEHGAPLEPEPGSGVLSRVSPAGVTLRFTPAAGAAPAAAPPPAVEPDTSAPDSVRIHQDSIGAPVTGRVVAVTGASDTVRLADSVTVVANIIPAAVSPGGRFVAYEAGDGVHVRNLGTGSDRVVGTGIAPRSLPFTDAFLYFRPNGQGEGSEGKGGLIGYDVVAIPFAGGAAHTIAQVKLLAYSQLFEAMSPARWGRIVEHEGGFRLRTTGLDLPLPTTLEAIGP